MRKKFKTNLKRTHKKCAKWLHANAKLLKRIGIAVASLIAFVLVVQLVYPSERTTPFSRLGSEKIGFMDADKAIKTINDAYKDARYIVKLNNKEYEKSADQIGRAIDADLTIEKAVSYSWWQRLIPGSLIVRILQPQVDAYYTEDSEKLADFAALIEKDNKKPAVNADFAVKDNELVIVPDEQGRAYPSDATLKALRSAPIAKTIIIDLQPKATDAALKGVDIEPLLNSARQATEKPLEITLADRSVVANKKTLVSWISLNYDTKTKEADFKISEKSIKAYLDKAWPNAYIEPGKTIIVTVDGRETGRLLGAKGRGIDYKKTAQSIETEMRDKSSDRRVAAPLVSIVPSVEYRRSYTHTQAGLQALINQVASDKGGYGISVIELSGQRMSASANGDKKFVTASTYKLFVAYMVLKDIESGKLKWNDIAEGGRTVERCFEEMITVSANECSSNWLRNVYGAQTVQNVMHNLGLTSTTLNASPNMTSTVNDEALFLKKLYDGVLMSSTSREKLLSAMRRQVYREGIPSGTSGAVVADKVGFLEGYLNDAAIVYSPNGDYVMVIMTYGSSWGNIADAARQIHNFLAR